MMHAALDPVAKIPEYKVAAVAVDPVAERTDSEPLAVAHHSSEQGPEDAG